MANYTILDENSVKKYAVEVLKFFPKEEGLTCSEIGDGNLNNVFRVMNTETNQSLIVKQALPYARTSVEMALTAQRCKTEAMALIEQGKHARGMVPEVYRYDEDLCAMAMEDLKGYSILRTAMVQQEEIPVLAKQSAMFFANTLIKTSDIVLDSKTKKDEVMRFKNSDLCELTEELVFTQPTYACKRNRVDEHLIEFVKENIYSDKNLELEFAKLKYKFMTSAQALLHGDAHSGSVFAKKEVVKFFDTEFSFYGPMGFDVGMFLGNLMMDACYQYANNYMDYKEKVITAIEEFIDEFKNQFNLVWDEFANEYYAKNADELKSWYLEEVLKDVAGYCGAEMIRRTIGSSHVKEMDDYKDRGAQKKAQVKNIRMAKELILNQAKFTTGLDYKNLLNQHLN